MRRKIKAVTLLLIACLYPVVLALKAARFGFVNVSVLWETDEVLHLVGKTFSCQCLLVVISDASLLDSDFSPVSGSGHEPSEMASIAIFKVRNASEGGTNVTKSLMSKVVGQAQRLRFSSWCVTIVVISDDPVFLIAFAEASDSTRLLVWETKLLVVTRLAKRHLQELLNNYWTFSMMNTVFVTSTAAPGYRCEGYVHVPYSPLGAQVVRVARWSRGDMKVLIHLLFPQKYRNFHGMKVNMTWFVFPPYWMKSEPSSDSSVRPIPAGREILIMDAIAKSLNFSVNLILEKEDDEDWMAPLRTRESLIRPVSLPIMPHILKDLDITNYLEPSNLAFTLDKPTLKPNWKSLLYPLQAEVWGSIIVALTVVFVVLLMFTAGTNKMKHDNEWEDPEVWMVVKIVVGTLVDEAVAGELPQRNSTRVVVATWLISAFIVGTVYKSNLTACLTIPIYPTRAEDLVDLVSMGIKITMLPEMVMFYKSFKESGSEVLVALTERLEYVPTSMEGLNKAVTQHKAHIYERLFMEVQVAEHFTNEDGYSPLYVTQGNIMSGYNTFLLTRNAPFKANLDNCIMALHEAGLIRLWTTKVMEKVKRDIFRRKWKSQYKLKGEQDEGILALTLLHIQGPLLLYFAGNFVSFIAFVSENVCQKDGAMLHTKY